MIIKTADNLPKNDDFTFTAIDFERANNCQSSICQIGLCVVERGRVVKCAEYLVKPPKRICFFQQKPVEIHGITYEDVADAPSFAEVWREILPDIEGRPLAAHSFRDDAKTLEAALRSFRLKYDYKAAGYICTLELALRAGIHGENNKYSLESLCERYSVPLRAHHAGSDAEGCARLALKIAGELGIDSFRKLAELSQPPEVPEPDLPDTLSCADLEELEKYISRLKSKKNIRLADCPKARELGRAKRILHHTPDAQLAKETAMSANGLNNWLMRAENETPAPRRPRRRGGRRRTKRAAPPQLS